MPRPPAARPDPHPLALGRRDLGHLVRVRVHVHGHVARARRVAQALPPLEVGQLRDSRQRLSLIHISEPTRRS
eukprot:7138690-Prymnesium_polylepis.1